MKPSNTDIVRVNGVIDASATLTTTAGDIAKMIDPATGQRVAAGKYGDFVLAKPIASLGPYISGRIDDDKAESRRYERFRLSATDNQPKVRFRFVQAGTGSWWWGIDDFGVYGAGQAGLFLSVARQGNNLVLSWTGTATLQSSADIAGPWTNVNGASPQTVTPSGAKQFYRLKQ